MAKQLTDEQKEARRKYQADRRKNGLCNSCSNKAIEGKTRCQSCLDRAATRAAKTYQNRKALGVCPQCKKAPAAEDSVYCKDCLKYHKDRMDIRRQADDYKEQQKARAAKWYRQKREDGICPQCNDQLAVPGKVNCAECQEDANARFRAKNAERRNIVLAHYGVICACCGEDNVELLQLDHVAGGGNAHRKEIGKGGLYAWLIKNGFPAGFSTLCGSCNFAWGHNRCCPHARDRLIPIQLDGKAVLRDPQTGKIARA